MTNRQKRTAALVAASMASALLMAGAAFAQAPPAAAPTAAAKPAPAAAAKPEAKKLPHAAVLMWKPAQQLSGFKEMEKYFDYKTIKKGPTTIPIPAGKPIAVKVTFKGKTQTVDAFMKQWRITGLMAVKNGNVVLEQYALGRKADDRWTTFSVAKSVSSTLIGAAIKDHYITSLTDMVTTYVPELKGSGYDNVNIKELITMTSGVKWNEDYTNPKSDVAMELSLPFDPKMGEDPVIKYMSKLPSEAKPGTKWVYKTGETDLAGIVLARALAGKSLSQYASEKLWGPLGMEQDGIWMTEPGGVERAGCCISMTLHDYARLGLFMLNGGVAGGKDVLPAGWIGQATTNQVPPPGRYGYFWWPDEEGNYAARGIYGQGIMIYPGENLVIAINSAMLKATDKTQAEASTALFKAIRDAANKAG